MEVDGLLHPAYSPVGQVVVERFAGAPHTVARIKAFAQSSQRYYPLRVVVEDLCAGLQSKDYLSEILAVYYWVLAHTRYMNDPRNVELVRSPAEVVNSWRAGRTPSLDCDDIVALIVGMLLLLGREVRILTVAWSHQFYKGERQYNHVFIQVREPRSGHWIVLDPVAAEDTATMLRRIKAVKFWPVA